MEITFENGEKYLFEKNEVVRIVPTPHKKSNTECKEKNINNLVFNDIILKAESDYPNLYYYNAVSDNCQKFIKHLINKMGIYDMDDFIMQYHVKDIVGANTKKIAHFITTLSASIKRYLLGVGVEGTVQA